HPLVAAEFLAVGGRSTEDLAPPGGDIAAMVRVYAAGKEPRQQIVAFDAVVERVDHPVKGIASACPLVQGRILGHGRKLAPDSLDPITRSMASAAPQPGAYPVRRWR